MVTPPRSDEPAGYAESAPAGRPGQNGRTAEGDPVARLASQVQELQTYLQYHLAARADKFAFKLRQSALLAGIGLVGFVALVGLVVTSVALLLAGIAGGLAALFESLWLGRFLTGLGVLVLLGAGTYAFYAGWTRKSRQRTIEKYEGRKQDQRRQYGHSVADRAGVAGRASGQR